MSTADVFKVFLDRFYRDEWNKYLPHVLPVIRGTNTTISGSALTYPDTTFLGTEVRDAQSPQFAQATAGIKQQVENHQIANRAWVLTLRGRKLHALVYDPSRVTFVADMRTAYPLITEAVVVDADVAARIMTEVFTSNSVTEDRAGETHYVISGGPAFDTIQGFVAHMSHIARRDSAEA